jgi:aromatic ring-opening dioxygenase catalytic subunit (LigB family)
MAKPEDWALEFDTIVKSKLDNRNYESLIEYQKLGASALMSVSVAEDQLSSYVIHTRFGR